MRDAGPELTVVKQALRVWLEGELPAEPTPTPEGIVYLPDPSELTLLSSRLNKRLEDERLTCGDVSKPSYRCAAGDPGEDNERGYVGDVAISSLDYGRYVLVVTSVGVRCGFDQSAYIYARGPDHRWLLLLKTEQDNYDEKEYSPQDFLSIAVSPSSVAWNERAPPPLVLTLGYSPWCSSNWHSLSARLWRASVSTPTPPALMDRDDELYMGDDSIASARLSEKDLLIEFRGRSIDGGTLIRSHVEHYRIGQGDKLERIAPVALNPNDFVEEWLTSDWPEAEHWIDVRTDNSWLARRHIALKGFGDFDGPAKRCRSDPTLWQASFAVDKGKAASDFGPSNYFIIRWSAPYRFTLVRIEDHPVPGCDLADAMPDNVGTLFPPQGWTPH